MYFLTTLVRTIVSITKKWKILLITNLCAPECATEISTPRDTFNFIVRNFPGKKDLEEDFIYAGWFCKNKILE